MQTLRPYQERILAAQQTAWRSKHRRILVVAPTGAGKTTVAVENISRSVARGFQCLFLAHRTELIEQCSQRLGDIPHGIIKGTTKQQLELPVQVASVQTLVNRPRWGGERMFVFVDECHRSVGPTYQKVLNQYPAAFIVGLTATPYRLDGTGFEDDFDVLLEVVTPLELIEQGYLEEPRVFAEAQIGTSDIKTRGGEFDAKTLEVAALKITGEIVPAWRKHAEGRQTLCFAVGIAQSKAIVEAFNAEGIPAAHVDGTTPKEERRRILERLASGDLRVVSNVDVLTEGFDGSSYAAGDGEYKPLGCLIAARPTRSMGLWFQMLGRITRPGCPKVIIDHAGNTLRHGFLRGHCGFTLPGMKKEKGKAKEPPQGWRCKECEAVNPPQKQECEECGAERPGGRDLVQRKGDLAELVADMRRTATPAEKASHYRDLLLQAQEKGYKYGWASHRFSEKYGEWPATQVRSRLFRELGIPRGKWIEE